MLVILIFLNFFLKFLAENIDTKENQRKNTNANRNMNNQMNNYNNNMPTTNGEKCDGCFDGYAVCFCITCEKIFCKMCEDQIHIVPSNRQHER